jgi:predicted dithiol-disulfide oxidoreductase (DUF899 family)
MSTQTKPPEPRAPTLAHAIVSREEWVKTRKELLKKEKEFTGNAMNLAVSVAEPEVRGWQTHLQTIIIVC